MMPDLHARWDWYQATLDGFEEGELPMLLALTFGATVQRSKGRNGYAIGQQVVRDNDVLAEVFERSARPGEVNVKISSDACDEVVPVLRRRWPIHRVTRADSAVDFTADFAGIESKVIAFAEARGIAHEGHNDSAGGATRYVGARSSEVRMRVYKKSEQLRAKHPERAHLVPDGIVRFELVVRPGKRDAKEALATASAIDAWGFGKWSQEVAGMMLGLDAERTRTHFRRPTSDERAFQAFVEQYGPMMRRRVLQHGVDAFLAELVEAALLDEGAEVAAPVDALGGRSGPL